MDTTRWGDDYPTERVDAADDASQLPPISMDDSDPNNPFDEPDVALELQQQRSDSLYSRNTPFWERVVEVPPEGEQYPQDPYFWEHPEEITGDVIMRVRDETIAEQIWKRLANRTTLYVVGIMAIVLCVTLFVYSALTTVLSINVTGNTRFTNEQVVALSGLEVGMHSHSIDEDVVTERIERERYLRCVLVDVTGNTVTLHVRERAPAATIVQNGRRIILDERGWVLEISDDMYTLPEGLVNVTGLDVQHCNLGQTVALRMPERLYAYMQILVELRALGGLDLITELDMTTMDSITLKMADGTTILLGNEEYIHEKVRAWLVVRENLILNNYYGKSRGGTIIVADPTSPAYMPPGV